MDNDRQTDGEREKERSATLKKIKNGKYKESKWG